MVYVQQIGRLLPNYRDIDVDGEEERLPYLGNSDFYAWQQIPVTDVATEFEHSDSNLPGAPTGSTGGASRRIQGEIRLPSPPLPTDSSDASGAQLRAEERSGEDVAPSMEIKGTNFPSQGGGVLPPLQPSIQPLDDEFRDLFEDFNRESDENEVPPHEEVPSGSGQQQEVGQGGSMSSRPSQQEVGQGGSMTSRSRQLRNRNVLPGQ